MNKIKVIFDTNSSIGGNRNNFSFDNIFCKNVLNYAEFIKRHKISERTKICLTDTVFKEGVFELQRRLIARFGEIKKLNAELKGLLKIPSIKDHGTAILKAKIKVKFLSKIKENDVQILLPPKVSLKVMSQRALNRQPPFEEGDKGLKDSLILFSIIEDAIICEDYDYILVTNDDIFFDVNITREFLELTKRKITVIRPEALEEVIDTDLGLGIGLEKVREEVVKKIDDDKDFQNLLEKKGLKTVSQDSSPLAAVFIHSRYNADWKSRVVNLIFKEAKIDVRDRVKDSMFRIEASIYFNALYSGLATSRGTQTMAPDYTAFNGSLNATQVIFDQSDFVINPHFPLSASTNRTNNNPALLSQRFVFSYNQVTKKLSIEEVGEIGASVNYLWS